MSPTGSMLAFDQLTVAVKDVDSAAADWELLLGWHPAERDSARFDLEAGSIQLIPAGDGPTGVVKVSVAARHVAAIADRIETAHGKIAARDGRTLHIDAASLNGVPLALVEADGPTINTGQSNYVRINHLVVAVSDLSSAIQRWKGYFGAWTPKAENPGEISEHVPVGDSWFGLTAAGTNGEALERFIARSGEGVYAVGIVVDDLPRAVAELQSRGARLIGDAGSPQVFVHPASTHGVLINLVPAKGAASSPKRKHTNRFIQLLDGVQAGPQLPPGIPLMKM